MNELDSYVGDVLIPQHTSGQTRRHNKEYREYERLIKVARDLGDKDLVTRLERERRKIPSRDTYDPKFRRLKYVRYADDFILSFMGTKQEAEAIRDAIAKFLQEKLKLELSMEKTKITHAKTEKARFLGYDISIYHVDEKIKSHPHMLSKRRTINGFI